MGKFTPDMWELFNGQLIRDQHFSLRRRDKDGKVMEPLLLRGVVNLVQKKEASVIFKKSGRAIEDYKENRKELKQGILNRIPSNFMPWDSCYLYKGVKGYGEKT